MSAFQPIAWIVHTPPDAPNRRLLHRNRPRTISLILVVLRIGQGLERQFPIDASASATLADSSPEGDLADRVLGNLAGNGSSPLRAWSCRCW